MSKTIFLAKDGGYNTALGAFYTVFDAVEFLRNNNHIDKDLEKDIACDMDFPENQEDWTEEQVEYYNESVFEAIRDDYTESIELHD
jgi:hypothetical protein